jgi:hypothetical protein
VGIFGLAVLALLSPLIVFSLWHQWIKAKGPTLDGELTKASHGAGLIVFTPVVGYFLFKLYPPPAPYNLAALAVLAAAIIWGGLWLTTGAARIPRGTTDARFSSRAVVKIGFGIAAAVFFFGDFLLGSRSPGAALMQNFERQGQGLGLIAVALWVIAPVLAGWCIITGLTKFLLLARGRQPAAPQGLPFSRGRADDANRDAALGALRGSSRNQSFDDMEF